MTEQKSKARQSQKKTSISSRSPSDSRIPVRTNSTMSIKANASDVEKATPPIIKKANSVKCPVLNQSTHTRSSLPTRSLSTKASVTSKHISTKKGSLSDKPAFTETSSVTQDIDHHQKNLNKLNAEIAQYQEMMKEFEQELPRKNSHLNEALATIEQLHQEIKTKSEAHEEEIKRLHDKFQREQLLQRYQSTKNAYAQYETIAEQKKEEIERAIRTYEQEAKENASLLNKKRGYEESYAHSDSLLAQKKQKIKQQKSAILKADNTLSDIAQKLQQMASTADQAEGALLTNEERRRKAHDRVQELKGNIRVFCRVKPQLSNGTNNVTNKSALSKEAANSSTNKENDEFVSFKFFGEDHEGLEFEEKTSFGHTKKHTFSFDRVFRPEETQEDCYEEISQLVQSALDGYNVSIFAYGQTGSGKTYTMQGPSRNRSDTATPQLSGNSNVHILHREAGMIPRAVHQIYDVANKLKKLNWNYTITGEFLEIYNEVIHDLLGDPSDYGKIKHDIFLDSCDKITVSKLTSVDLHSPEQVQSMLNKAMKNRSIAATKLNLASSRSHCVFTLRITGENVESKETRLGVLNLIDLAGSESVSKSGSEGERFREASNINKSLSYLGNVIQALAKRSSHVPYRDSKLTYLLKDSFGGNCKTLMFVNISPEKRHLRETLFSLRFATTVNSCKVPRAKQN